MISCPAVQSRPAWCANNLCVRDGCVLRDHDGPPDAFEMIIQSMITTHRVKAHDYGASLNAVKELGITPFTGILIRMSDKWSRIKTLRERGPEVQEETIEDTLLDLASYAILAVMELRHGKK